MQTHPKKPALKNNQNKRNKGRVQRHFHDHGGKEYAIQVAIKSTFAAYARKHGFSTFSVRKAILGYGIDVRQLRIDHNILQQDGWKYRYIPKSRLPKVTIGSDDPDNINLINRQKRLSRGRQVHWQKKAV